jgi:hypothetical protein
MCWSLEVSLFTTVLVYISVFVLWKRNAINDRNNAIFLMTFGSMQLVDLIFWVLYDFDRLGCERYGANHIMTLAAGTIIMLEPFASLAGRIYRLKTFPTVLETMTYFASFVLYTMYLRITPSPCVVCTSLSDNSHLRYFYHIDGCTNWLEVPLSLRIMFLIGMVYPYTSMRKKSAIMQITILVATWIVGYLTDAFSSMWCLTNVFQIVTMLADPYV